MERITRRKINRIIKNHSRRESIKSRFRIILEKSYGLYDRKLTIIFRYIVAPIRISLLLIKFLIIQLLKPIFYLYWKIIIPFARYLRQGLSQISYLNEKLMTGRLSRQFLFLIIIALIITSSISIIISYLDNGQFTLTALQDGNSLWNILSRFLTPESLAEVTGTWIHKIIMLITLILGILFTSYLIGTITTGLEDSMRAYRLGIKPVSERNHILIIGWNEEIYRQLESINRFYIIDYKLSSKLFKKVVVVMSQMDRVTMDSLISSNCDTKGISRLRIVCRKGNPIFKNDIMKLRPEFAKAIIVNYKENEVNELESEFTTSIVLQSIQEKTPRRIRRLQNKIIKLGSLKSDIEMYKKKEGSKERSSNYLKGIILKKYSVYEKIVHKNINDSLRSLNHKQSKHKFSRTIIYNGQYRPIVDRTNLITERKIYGDSIISSLVVQSVFQPIIGSLIQFWLDPDRNNPSIIKVPATKLRSVYSGGLKAWFSVDDVYDMNYNVHIEIPGLAVLGFKQFGTYYINPYKYADSQQKLDLEPHSSTSEKRYPVKTGYNIDPDTEVMLLAPFRGNPRGEYRLAGGIPNKGVLLVIGYNADIIYSLQQKVKNENSEIDKVLVIAPDLEEANFAEDEVQFFHTSWPPDEEVIDNVYSSTGSTVTRILVLAENPFWNNDTGAEIKYINDYNVHKILHWLKYSIISKDEWASTAIVCVMNSDINPHYLFYETNVTVIKKDKLLGDLISNMTTDHSIYDIFVQGFLNNESSLSINIRDISWSILKKGYYPEMCHDYRLKNGETVIGYISSGEVILNPQLTNKLRVMEHFGYSEIKPEALITISGDNLFFESPGVEVAVREIVGQPYGALDLNDLKNIETITLNNTSLYNNDMLKLKNLKTLYLTSNRLVPDGTYNQFLRIKRDKMLKNKLVYDYDGIKHLTELDYLGLDNISENFSLSLLESLPSLKNLGITRCNFLLDDIGQLTRLEGLKIEEGFRFSLKPLENMHDLQFLALVKCLGLDDLDSLAQIPNLKKIYLGQTYIPKGLIEHLEKKGVGIF